MPCNQEEVLPPVECWLVVAVTRAGKAHRDRGTDNEDAVHVVSGRERLALAVADGAGSARRAAHGSRLAARAACEYLLEHDDGREWPEIAEGAVVAVRNELAGAARRGRFPPRQLATTLLAAVVDGKRVRALQVGDGAVTVRAGGEWSRLTEPQRGRYASETVFVTSRRRGAHAHANERELKDVEAVVLFSDGLEPVATEVATGSPHAPFLDPLVSFVRSGRSREELEAQLGAFLTSERMAERTADDLSIVIAARKLS